MSIAVAHPVRHDPSPYKHRISHSQSSRPPPPAQYPAQQPQPQHTHRPSASTSQQPSTSTHSAYDTYYGHEETAKICARYISFTFSCPETLPPPPQSNALEPAARHPPIPSTLAHFVAYALHRTRLHGSVTFLSLALLHRLKGRFPAARGSSGHRLFLAAFMLASKVACDDTYSNKSWAVVGQGMFALREVNQMEREMCGYLAWGLNVCGEELEAFEKEVRRIFRRPGPYTEQLRVSLAFGVGGPKISRPSPCELEDPEVIQHLAIPERVAHQLPTPTETGAAAPMFPTTTRPAVPHISTANAMAQSKSQLPSPPDSPPPSSIDTGSSTVVDGAAPFTADEEEDDTDSEDEDEDRRIRSPSPASSEESPLPTPPTSASVDPHITASAMKRQHSLKYPHAQSQTQKLAKSSSLPGAMSASAYAQQHAQARASVPPALGHYREPMSVTAAHMGGAGIDATAGMEVDGVHPRDLDDERRQGTGYYATAIRAHPSTDSSAAPGGRTRLEKEMFAFSSASGAAAAAAGVKREREPSSSAKDREMMAKEKERERETKKAATAIYAPPVREGWSGSGTSSGKIVSSSSSSRQDRDKRNLKTFTVPCTW